VECRQDSKRLGPEQYADNFQELPDGEITHEEKLDGAEERGETNTGQPCGAASQRPIATLIGSWHDDRDYLVEAMKMSR